MCVFVGVCVFNLKTFTQEYRLQSRPFLRLHLRPGAGERIVNIHWQLFIIRHIHHVYFQLQAGSRAASEARDGSGFWIQEVAFCLSKQLVLVIGAI